MPRPTFSRRQILEYIVQNPKRYSNEVVESAKKTLAGRYVDQRTADEQSRAKERNSAQRSAARNRRPSGMSSQNTRDAVNKGTGLSRMSVSDRDRLRTMADSYATFGWAT